MIETQQKAGIRQSGTRSRRGLGLGLVLLLGAFWAAPLQAQAGVGGQDGLTLGEALRTALERSPRVQSARYQLTVAEERVSEAWSSVYPKLDFSGDYTRNVSPAISFLPAIIFDPSAGPDEQVAVQFGADNTWLSGLNLEQPLFDGRAFVGVGAASRFLTLTEEVLRGEVQSVVTRVRGVFYRALLAGEQERLIGQSVARVSAALDETRALFRAGLAAEYDVLRLEVELANLEPNLLRARNAVVEARRELALELDLGPEAPAVAGSLATLVLNDPAANTPDNREILLWAGAGGADTETETMVDAALENRSDLRQLRVTEDLRLAELRAEQAEYLPRVTLFGNYSVSASQNGAPAFFGEPRAYSRRVGVRVSVPIFQGFARASRIDQRQATLRGAQVDTRFAQGAAENEVRSLVDQVSEARVRAEAQAGAVRTAQRGYQIASAQFREGLGGRLDLTDAELALRQSEFNYAQAVYDYLSARAQLDEATGLVPTTPGEVGP